MTTTHLDMKSHELFPVDPSVQEKSPMNFDSFRDPQNKPRPWFYRATSELTAGEAIKLFMPAPHDSLQTIRKECDDIEGDSFVQLIKIEIPKLQPPKRPPASRLKRLAVKLAERMLDMIPREPAEFAVKQAKVETEALVMRAKQEMRTKMARHFRDLASKIERGIVPSPKAPVREGLDYKGQRVVAVWTGAGEPTEEPTF